MKKLVTIVCALLLIISVPIPTFASESSKIVPDNLIVTELLTDGLSQKDAEYYATLDAYVKDLESQGKEIDFSNAVDLEDEWVRANPEEMRNRILQGDKAAIKKAVLNQAFLHGNEDIRELQEKDKKNNITRNKYSVKYPDGSELTFSGSTIKEEDINEKVETNTNFDASAPWNDSTWISSTYPSSAGNYSTKTEWQYKTGVNYSKVNNVTNWYWSNNSNKYGYLRSMNGASASYGVVSVASEDFQNNIGTSTTDISGFCCYADVRFQVSSSFSAGYKGLSISVGANGSWHQYAVTEIFGPFTHSWSAQYA